LVDRVTDLLIELNIGEYRVDAPRLAEHGTERQSESNAEHPRLQLDTQCTHCQSCVQMYDQIGKHIYPVKGPKFK